MPRWSSRRRHRNRGNGGKILVDSISLPTNRSLYAPYAGMIQIRLMGRGTHPPLSPSVRTPLCHHQYNHPRAVCQGVFLHFPPKTSPRRHGKEKRAHQRNSAVGSWGLFLLLCQIVGSAGFIEVIALAVDNHNGGEILHFQTTDGLCAQILIGDDLGLLDALA